MQQQYSCICNARLHSFQSVKKHILECQQYLRRCFFISSLDRIPKDVTNNDLQLLRAEVELVQERIRDRLFKGQQKIEKPSENNIHEPPINSTDIKMGTPMEQEFNVADSNIYSADICQCLNCRNKFFSSYDTNSLFYVEQCWHLFCKPCMIRHIDKQFVEKNGSVPCLFNGCQNTIPRQTISQLIGKEKLSLLDQKIVKKISNIISCFKCKAEFIFQPGKPEAVKDANGKPLTKQMEKHYADNRFSCFNCKTQQCKKCAVSPYHAGKTCQQFKLHSEALKCRYCLDVMQQKNTKSGIRALQDICNKKECEQQAKKACAKILGCGHSCKGIAGEKHCLPCLVQQCCEKNADMMGQKGDDYCAICYIESLDSAPCVRSVCGHIFHQKCLETRFNIRWIGPRILFNFCVCPLCKKWIQLPEDNPLVAKISQNHKIYEKIKSKCAQRLKFQGCEKDDKLVNPESQYYNKPTEYALAIFAYYQCFKCKQPYFGGRKSCQNVQQNQGQFNQQFLVCSNCCEIPVQNCPKHGKEHIQFKCRFCCSVAQWFCWGNTHFCQSCHQKQCKGQYISKYGKDKLPKCQGPGKCPVGGNHQGNGDEKPLGCAICRNIKESNKDF